jgi:putative transposase
MSIIKLEVKISEIRKALEGFRDNRKKALESLSNEIKIMISDTFNQLLNAELQIFLGKPEESDNKRNGFREREYNLKGLGTIRIKMPRDRKGRFESAVIPSHERTDPRVKAEMAVLHLAGLSTRTLSMISKRLLGVEVSRNTVNESLSLVKVEAEKWLTRPLSKKYWAIYIDGTNFRIKRRGTVEKEPSLVVLGVDENNYKSILAIEPGTRDNVEAWRAVFSSLRDRGFDSNAVRIGIMDGLPGLEKLFKEEFPNSLTARCWFHALGNAMAKTPKRFAAQFKKLAQKVMYASSENDARMAFLTLKQMMGQDAQKAVYCLEKNLDSLLVHYRFDKHFWVALKTTNSIERIHKELKRRTKSMDSVGESTLTVIVAFIALKMEFGWQKYKINSPALQNLMYLKKLEEINTVEKAVENIGLLN